MPSDCGEKQSAACPYPDYREQGSESDGVPAIGKGARGVERKIWDALYTVEDPEMPVSIVDLGLIYGVRVDNTHVMIDVTLTYTGCPARQLLLDDVKAAAMRPDEIETAETNLTWNPPWTVELVTDRGKQALREFGLSV